MVDFSIVMLAFRGGNNLPSWFRSLRLQWEAHSFEVSNEKPVYVNLRLFHKPL